MSFEYFQLNVRAQKWMMTIWQENIDFSKTERDMNISRGYGRSSEMDYS